MAEKKQKEEVEETLIYIGPTIQRAQLVRYQLFVGGYPKHCEALFEKHSVLKHLFVPVNEFVRAEKEIKEQGTPLHKYYSMVQEVE